MPVPSFLLYLRLDYKLTPHCRLQTERLLEIPCERGDCACRAGKAGIKHATARGTGGQWGREGGRADAGGCGCSGLFLKSQSWRGGHE